jgi:hypothetical protein
MRRTVDQGQPEQIVQETLSQKYPTQKRAGRVALSGFLGLPA